MTIHLDLTDWTGEDAVPTVDPGTGLDDVSLALGDVQIILGPGQFEALYNAVREWFEEVPDTGQCLATHRGERCLLPAGHAKAGGHQSERYCWGFDGSERPKKGGKPR